jgi:hypothetical protein
MAGEFEETVAMEDDVTATKKAGRVLEFVVDVVVVYDWIVSRTAEVVAGEYVVVAMDDWGMSFGADVVVMRLDLLYMDEVDIESCCTKKRCLYSERKQYQNSHDQYIPSH